MRTLLLADDSVTTQRIIALTFAEESFRVVSVSTGQQAIDSMAVMRPDIVLAGTALPRTNGYELAEYMRGVEMLRDVPVLLLSGAFESVDAVRLKASGARGLIEKPLEPTTVISRVRELLGLKDARPTPSAGRLVTSADTPADRKAAPSVVAAPPAARQPSVSSRDGLRQEPGLEPDAWPGEESTPGSGREDHLDTLDAAFDSLDQHLAGRHQEAHPQHRNPSPPLGQSSGAPDPRSPGRRPSPTSGGAPANSVFEVDSDWFSDEHQASDTDSRNEIVAAAHAAMPPRPDVPANPIFEVDDEWFAEDEKAREARRAQQRELAAEMGIHEVELPEAEPVPNAPAPAGDLDFDFGLHDLMPVEQSTQGPAPDSAPQAPLAPSVPTVLVPNFVADDFAALLAFETGDAVPQQEPALPAPTAAAPAPVVVQAAAPEITDAMLDQIAQRVADRLNSGAFGAQLRDAMTATVRDTVRSVVSDTSERLVRDEIERIKSKTQT